MEVDPVVQNAVAGTCGNLYRHLVGRLPRYPIPGFPLAPGGRELLDIGCGWGRWTIAAAQAGFQPVGLDPDPDMVAAAGRIAAQLGAEASFVVGGAAELPFDDDSFDAVFSYSVLQHLPEESVAVAFAEMHRVLRPGGVALVELPNHYGVWNLVRRMGVQRAPMRYYTPREMRTLGRLVGDTRLRPDAFVSLNAQATDLDLLERRGRAVVRASGLLVRLARVVPGLALLADSVWVEAGR